MERKRIRRLDGLVETRLLPCVRRPGRYIGGEVNQVRKDLEACDVRIALGFPDVYEIGMSHTGLAILYHVLNGMAGVAAERVFCPWLDAEAVMRRESIPLFTLESSAAVGDFDIIAVSLTNELCYTNLLTMLDLAGLAVRAADRGPGDPLVVVGGQAVNAGEPISPFVDLMVLGEGEGIVERLVDWYRQGRTAGWSKDELLAAAVRECESVYVPALYRFRYEGERIRVFEPLEPGLRARFENAVVADLDAAPVPDRPIVPHVEPVHDRISIEVMRGCPGRCRFCQASFCRRPIRYRSVDRIVEIARAQYAATGQDTIGLLSLSTGDYPHLAELVERLRAEFEPRHVGLSIPSLRVQDELRLVPAGMTSVRKGGLTIAVEAAGARLRRVINKPLSDDGLLAAVEAAYRVGFRKVKLYFMVGLPGETDADIVRIVDLAQAVGERRRAVDGRVAEVNAAVSWLVPKPHTPFQWIGQREAGYFERARGMLLDRKRQRRARFVRLKFHDIGRSVLESAMGRGDRRLADVIEAAWRDGARFDLWDEGFEMGRWERAFAACGMDLAEQAGRSFETDAVLPWEHLGGPRKQALLGHYQQAMALLDDPAGV